MAANPLITAQNRARKDDRFLAKLFAQFIGGTKHPRGAILSAYRIARRELARVVDDPAAAEEVLNNLRFALLNITNTGLTDAIRNGQESALTQAGAYNADGQNIGIAASVPDLGAYQNAIMGSFDAQRTIISTMLRTGAGAALIVGDRTRLGALKPGPVMAEASRWFATSMQDGFKQSIKAPGWEKQAIPVFDQFTTDCCIAAAGQIQPIDGDFHLTDDPRFAEFQDWTPFHWHCRTSIALYRASYDDGLTQAIRKDAIAERKRRETQET